MLLLPLLGRICTPLRPRKPDLKKVIYSDNFSSVPSIPLLRLLLLLLLLLFLLAISVFVLSSVAHARNHDRSQHQGLRFSSVCVQFSLALGSSFRNGNYVSGGSLPRHASYGNLQPGFVVAVRVSASRMPIVHLCSQAFGREKSHVMKNNPYRSPSGRSGLLAVFRNTFVIDNILGTIGRSIF